MKNRLAFLILVFALSLAGCNGGGSSNTSSTPSTLSRVRAQGSIKVGFAGYPPYLEKDPNSGAMSGYSVELAKKIFEPANLKIEWVETTWDTMVQDVNAGKFDVMVEPIFTTIPRALQVSFTRPYSYFGYGVAIVRVSDTRFKTFSDLNLPTVNVVVTQGVTDDELASIRLKQAKVRRIPGKDISLTLNEVLVGKADVALADVPTAISFVDKHKDKVKALFLDTPPAVTPASFMTRQGNPDLVDFLNTSLNYLEVNGTLDALEREYKLPSFREKKAFIRGSGLR